MHSLLLIMWPVTINIIITTVNGKIHKIRGYHKFGIKDGRRVDFVGMRIAATFHVQYASAAIHLERI